MARPPRRVREREQLSAPTAAAAAAAGGAVAPQHIAVHNPKYHSYLIQLMSFVDQQVYEPQTMFTEEKLGKPLLLLLLKHTEIKTSTVVDVHGGGRFTFPYTVV